MPIVSTSILQGRAANGASTSSACVSAEHVEFVVPANLAASTHEGDCPRLIQPSMMSEREAPVVHLSWNQE